MGESFGRQGTTGQTPPAPGSMDDQRTWRVDAPGGAGANANGNAIVNGNGVSEVQRGMGPGAAGTSLPDQVAVPAGVGERVLLLAPIGRDGPLLADQLRRRGTDVQICRDIHELCDGIDHAAPPLDARDTGPGAGALFIAEEALAGDALQCLVDHLRRQPPWSDLPIIVMTDTHASAAQSRRLSAVVQAAGNVTLLERPIRLATLFSVVDSGLKSRRRQYEVRGLLEQMRQAVEQRDRFLAMLGHELRNPLAAVVNAVSILRKFGNGDIELSQEQCEVIARQSSHMARLVDDLLDVARITSGKIVLNLQPIDVREVAARAMQSLKLTLASQRHDIALDTPAQPLIVNGDAVRLEQVLMNLLTNAVKYTPEGGRIVLTVSRSRSIDGAGSDADATSTANADASLGEAVINVRDTGEGIPPDMRDRIFEPFAQVTQSLARSRGGLGLGLTVVRTLADMHGGSVSVKSEGIGRGTEFTIRLPIHASQPAPAKPDVTPASAKPCDILLVEDNPDSRRTLARLLRLFGHKVETAEDGPEGLRKALANKPEVVLLDIGLPGMDGYEVAFRVRQELGNTSFLIALTGYGQPEDRERVRQAGFDLHLVKPIDPEQLNRILSSRLNCDSRG